MIDLDKISKLTGFVDKLIQLKGIEDTLDEEKIAGLIQDAINFTQATYSKEEIDAARRDLTWRYEIQTSPGASILSDYEEDNFWYDDVKSGIEPKFWTRYKNYLIDEKHFSPNVVSTLGEDTLDQKLMNYILDPNANYGKPVLKRGLIIGDVQSGKTSTYIGFLCKAADAGYKVFILLTGTIESLRRQTQERVEEGFIGIDMSANKTGGQRVGVGLDNKPICAMSMTSRVSDFTGNNDKIAVSLASNNDAVVFVIKKNTTTLQKLTKWLLSLNADPVTHKIDMPMLMIDDEADNASVNTSADKEDPTKINKLIRELASIFTKSNYVGFTATPFANVFIDPETTEKMETQDLFPEDFIVSLPTPSNYIGANKIFDPDGEYHNQLTYIKDAGREEADGFSFWFKHTKEWQGELPNSLTDAMYAFYIVNAVRDMRGDFKDHRSMLINISRFVAVQKYIKSQVEDIHRSAYRAIKFNISGKDSLKDPVIRRIHEIYEQYYSFVEFSWEEIAGRMFESIENIQIKVVNSSRSSEKLEYPKNDSLRVIAIGGLALSRGLTLEGLIISYFYRNTSTYDVLMQMGRWFGYRKNYDDLFRIWTHKDSADWYAEIAEATDKLKDDMSLMRELRQKPKDFGIRVRNNSADLRITAYNKMRNATDEYEMNSYFGGIVETPYLYFDAEIQKQNYYEVRKMLSTCISEGYHFGRQESAVGKGRLLLSGVPKTDIVNLMRRIRISRFSSDFDPAQIADFLQNCTDSSIDRFDIAFMDGAADEKTRPLDLEGNELYPVVRKNCIIDSDTKRLSLGRRGKLGGPNDGLAGIVDFNGIPATEIVELAKKCFVRDYERLRGEKFEKKNYSSETWFRYVKDRRPLLIIYLLDIDSEEQQKQAEEFREALSGTPVVGFAMGLPRNDEAALLNATKYKANKIYNWFERDDLDVGEEE